MNNLHQTDFQQVKQQAEPVELLDKVVPPAQAGLFQRWYALTSLPDVSDNESFYRREIVRRSRLSSSVIFFFLVLLLGMMPVTLLVIGIYPYYFWLTLGLFVVCVFALFVNRSGHTNIAGFIVTFGAFAILTTALFTTVPFDETTLQGYDMYVVLLLLSIALLPVRWVMLFYVLSVGVIIVSLFKMPLTPTLQADVHSRVILILFRPIGLLFMSTGVAWIFSSVLTNAIRRANQAETIVQLEREQRRLSQNLESGVQQILETHVKISNGDLNARAPLSEDNVLWQIARALNTLLVRYQRAAQAERDLQKVDETVRVLVERVQKSGNNSSVSVPLTGNPHLDPVLTELQGKQVVFDRSRFAPKTNDFTGSMNPPRPWGGV
jgi:hypothetical protein